MILHEDWNYFLRFNLTGIITFPELSWIANKQSNFTRLEQ